MCFRGTKPLDTQEAVLQPDLQLARPVAVRDALGEGERAEAEEALERVQAEGGEEVGRGDGELEAGEVVRALVAGGLLVDGGGVVVVVETVEPRRC